MTAATPSAIGRRARRRGADGERDLARVLSAVLHVEAHRKATPYLPGIIAADVVGVEGLHVEAKRRERLCLPAALRQSTADAGPGEVAIVCHRANRCGWIVSAWLSDLPALARAVAGIAQRGPT
jgi:hypothetical protein